MIDYCHRFVEDYNAFLRGMQVIFRRLGMVDNPFDFQIVGPTSVAICNPSGLWQMYKNWDKYEAVPAVSFMKPNQTSLGLIFAHSATHDMFYIMTNGSLDIRLIGENGLYGPDCAKDFEQFLSALSLYLSYELARQESDFTLTEDQRLVAVNEMISVAGGARYTAFWSSIS